jgi:hypothetical protein
LGTGMTSTIPATTGYSTQYMAPGGVITEKVTTTTYTTTESGIPRP